MGMSSECCLVDGESVVLDHGELTRLPLAKFGKGGKTSPVPLDGYDRPTGPHQSAGEAARPRSHFVNPLSFERTGDAGDPVEQLLVKQEVLAERLGGIKSVPLDDFAQRRKIAHAAAMFRAARAAVFNAAIIDPG